MSASMAKAVNGGNLQSLHHQEVRRLDFLQGTKFFVVCEPGTQHMESLLKVIYELYTDYVLKNPFYEMEMPIPLYVSSSTSTYLR